MKIFVLLLAVIGGSWLYSASAQSINKSLNKSVQNKVDETLTTEKVPGVFVGILNNGERSYFQAGLGIPDKNTPFDSAMIFEIGSITKTFTAYVLMAVLMENNISEKKAIWEYLPDSVQQNKHLDNISFLSLLNHTSGLPRLPENMKLDNKIPYDHYTAADLFNFLKTVDINPDGENRYSNLGAGLAGVLASRISGKTFDELVNQHIFLPFTKTLHARAGTKNKIQGYFSAQEKIGFWNMDVLKPCGGLQYTADQMLTYLQNMAFPETEKAKAIVEKLTTETVALNKQIGVGLGWHIFHGLSDEPIYWHNGGTYGFSTFCAFSKNKSKAVIVVINEFNKNTGCDKLGAWIMKKLLREK